MPASRRLSSSRLAAASKRQSFPSTADSSTKLTKEKVGKIMTRRKTRRQTLAENHEKENRNEGLLQSPTPYWKVAMERGTNTPPKTRSARKRKSTEGGRKLAFSPDDGKENRSGILEFSPPNQEENRRREKAELDRSEQQRAKRVRKARDSGQLLVFSPTFREEAECNENNSPSGDKLSPQESTTEATEDDKTDNSTGGQSEQLGDSKTDVGSISQLSMSSSNSNPPNEQITSELRNLRETIDKLVESKATSGSQDSSDKVSLQDHMMRTEKLLVANTELQGAKAELEKQMMELQSRAALEKKKYESETIRLETTLGSTAAEASARVKNIENEKDQLSSQISALKKENQTLLDQHSKLEAEILSVREELSESTASLQTLKRELNSDHEKLVEELDQFKVSKEEMKTALLEEQEQSKALREAIMDYEEKLDLLENSLLPESEEQLEEALKKLKENEASHEELETQVGEYEQQIATFKKDLSSAQDERDEERKNFQELNEHSSSAYQEMNNDLQAKNDIIADLRASLQESNERVTMENSEVKGLSQSLEEMRSNMNHQIKDLEAALAIVQEELHRKTTENSELEEQLAEALNQIKSDAEFKEQVLEKNMEATASMKEMEEQRKSLMQRVQSLEGELEGTRTERDEAQQRMETFNMREEDLFNKLRESDRVRRSLHNRVMQLSGNIRVFVRVRPELPGELAATKETGKRKPDGPPTGRKTRMSKKDEEANIFQYPGMGGNCNKAALGADDPTKNLLEVTEPKKDRGGLSERRKKWTFGFDQVFTPNNHQGDIWEGTEPLVQSAIDGYNVTLFAYGQTGSGKTYTMLGEPGNAGLVSKSVQKLFLARNQILELSQGASKVDISVELLEIYNERVRDLLAPSNAREGEETSLKVKSSAAVGSVTVPVTCESEVDKIMQLAQDRRCVKATASNATSSRSHMLFTIHFKVTSVDGTGRSGRLNICDLAGSERLGKSNANEHVGGALLKETKHINTSLSVLSNVIEKLQSGESNVPFRESKLTSLLQNSLGGNSKTLAIVCCNPLQTHFHETLCSLRFAAKVNKVDLKAMANFSC